MMSLLEKAVVIITFIKAINVNFPDLFNRY